MTSGEQPCYTLIHVQNDVEFPTEQQLKDKFEKGDTKAKIEALKKLILMIQNGDKINQHLMMYVIRFCLPTSDHYLKKLLLIFWEVVPKTNSEGKLLHEMILVCDAYRKDLQHPNEFIRGSTLRFLCKLKEPELLEPLMPSIRKCLEHRHSYVRRNAVLAIFTIFKNFEFLISDGPELIAQLLETEQDASCKRNAFMMLLHVDQTRALDYLSTCIDQVTSFGDILQLIIVELIYKVCHTNPAERGRFIRCVYNLLQSQSGAVRYEAAGTLVTLSSAPTAIKAAASAYIDLIVKESDNNIKLIVLDRLTALRENVPNEKVLQELVMDILRVLSATDYEVRKKILQLALDLVSSRNVQEMVMFLKKEIDKTTNDSQEDVGRYRQLLVRTLHSATIKFPDVAQQIFPVLMEFLSDQSETAAADVLIFVREAIQRLPHLRSAIMHQLLDVFPLIRNANIYRSALWILGEYSDNTEVISKVFELVKASLGEVPIVESETREHEETGEITVEQKSTKNEAKPKQLVTADGTYATQSAFSSTTTPSSKLSEKPILRKLLLEGNFFIASALGGSLIKLVLRFAEINKGSMVAVNKLAGEALLVIASIIHLGKSGLCKTVITEDDLDRLSTTLRLIIDQWPGATEIFLNECRASLELMLVAKGDVDRHEDGHAKKSKIVQPDATISFTQLSARVGEGVTGTNLFDLSLSQALGTAPKTSKFDFATSKLGKVIQLAGFSDPVYAEAYVNVNQYDIVLDVLVVNQTADTLQNLCLELSTVGDLKLVDKPTPMTLAPHDFTNIKATVKVASTENGVIFSTIAYDVRGSTSDRNCVYLEDIHIDIMDYIVPGTCTDTEFRSMWAEFEWENKVGVVTPISDLRLYLDHLSLQTNMKLLTTDAALEGDCGFLAANFCAHSIFGEDALANVCIEKSDPLDPSSSIIGHIRIRAKSQGMALSLGDKINSAQKERKPIERGSKTVAAPI
ncbi:coatomer beta subunit appendage platform domain-containing protein [Ditylenchus destructor]|nr:coatomer beta subunit appendage platform domain-containing protein [Ditylenchus destructor]